jgi:SsrA-binding protein
MAKNKPKTSSDDPNAKTVCRNRKAYHEYEILDQLECGVALQGSEVKSVRNGKMSIDEAYVRVRDDELWLVGANIAEYPQATVMNHEPTRPRKLLLHRKEFRKFAEQAVQQGFTLIPLAVYFKRGIVKVQIALARGRKLYDKREKLKKDTDRKDMQRAMQRRSSR